MKISLQKYPAYKDSGVEWLGEIPSHWEVSRLKNHIDMITGFPFKSEKYTETGIKLARGINVKEGIFNWDETRCWPAIEKHLENYLLKEGDVLIAMDGSKVGKNFCKVRKEDLPILLLQRVARLRPTFNLHSDYLFNHIVNRNFLVWVEKSKTDPMVPHIAPADIYNFVITIPPIKEQTAIAAFLDRKTAFIDQAIGIKQKQIELLKERRQILIHKAVTRGLNPNVKMKDSGVEWIGEIPEGWEVKRIKHLGKIINGFAFNSGEFKDVGVRVMKISNIQTMRIDWSDESFVDEKYFRFYPQFQITRNDLVFALTRPIISTGIKATIVESDEKILLNQRNAVLKPSKDLCKKWIYFIILNTQFVQAFDNQIDKTGQQPNISTYNIGNLEIPFPEIAEQVLISEYLEIATTKIATAISLKEQEIEKLKEYKATLINSAVTGKIKVGQVVDVQLDIVKTTTVSG